MAVFFIELICSAFVGVIFGLFFVATDMPIIMSRLQRPEYLGGSSVPVNIAPVAQTSASAISGSATPQGNQSGIVTGKQIGRAHV